MFDLSAEGEAVAVAKSTDATNASDDDDDDDAIASDCDDGRLKS